MSKEEKLDKLLKLEKELTMMFDSDVRVALALLEEIRKSDKKDHVDCYEPDILICPHCNAEQAENPQNYIMDDINYVDCDECEKSFYFEEVYYISCFKEGPLEALENIAKSKEDE